MINLNSKPSRKHQENISNFPNISWQYTDYNENESMEIHDHFRPDVESHVKENNNTLENVIN